VPIDLQRALEPILAGDDEWRRWRARRLRGERDEDLPPIPYQDEEGGFVGAGGRLSPGATGEALCHLVVLDARDSGAAVVAADWLLEVRTPAEAWLDAPDDVPGDLDTPGGARVWATASAVCGLLAVNQDPGPRAVDLLRGEADLEGRFTGGAYPTFAGAAAYWMSQGPKTEMAEWSLRWAREWHEGSPEPWELATALTFWAAAGIPAEHPTVELFLDHLKASAPEDGWTDDPGLTLRTLELIRRLEDR
jgi:hypothetical protein